MMSEQEKAAFLKAEGWKKHLQRTGIYWEDPVTPSNGPEWVQMCPFDEAYRIASRRKARREMATLKKAEGWYRCNEGGYHLRKSVRIGGKSKCFTRSEAVKHLESSPLGDRQP